MSRTARRSLSRASRGSTFNSAHSCLSVTISMMGFAVLSFADRPPNKLVTILKMTVRTRQEKSE